jgi:hypothetical protein
MWYLNLPVFNELWYGAIPIACNRPPEKFSHQPEDLLLGKMAPSKLLFLEKHLDLIQTP